MQPIGIEELAEAIGAAPVNDADGVTIGPDVVIDSRLATPGCLFVALPGERVDGHDFVARAFEHGASAALITRGLEVPQPQLLVTDAVEGLSRLARHVVARAVDGGLVTLALTGSSGKTSTKDMLAQILEQAGPTVAPQGSFNNEIGVPLTATRVDDRTRYLVSEMGARGVGHLRWLTGIVPPAISVVLNVGHAHIGEFGSVEQIALAKGELVEALDADGWAVLNADDERVAAMERRTAARVAWFAVGTRPERPADQPVVWAEEVGADELDRHHFTIHFAGGRHQHGAPGSRASGSGAPDPGDPVFSGRVQLTQMGAHHVPNAVAAAAAAWRAGLDPEAITASLGAVVARSRWRMELIERPDGAVIVNDAYNANPDSMLAAITAVGRIAARRRQGRPGARAVAVLGDMLELGPGGAQAHEQVGRLLAEHGFDQLVAVGEYAQALAAGASSAGVAATAGDAADACELELHDGDVVLIKASRGLALEKVADVLAGPATPSPGVGRESNRSGDTR